MHLWLACALGTAVSGSPCSYCCPELERQSSLRSLFGSAKRRAILQGSARGVSYRCCRCALHCCALHPKLRSRGPLYRRRLDGRRRRGAQLSQAIGEENKLSKAAAEGLEEALEKARAALSRGLRRVNRALRQGRSNHMIYLVVFAFAVLIGVYVWAKLYRMVRWLI